MDLQNVTDFESHLLHEGTAEVWTLIADPKEGSSISYFNDFYVHPASAGVPLHNHDQEEIFYVLHGKGEMTVEGDVQTVASGDAIYIPSRALHSIRNTGRHPLRVIVIGVMPRHIPPEMADRDTTYSTASLQAR